MNQTRERDYGVRKVDTAKSEIPVYIPSVTKLVEVCQEDARHYFCYQCWQPTVQCLHPSLGGLFSVGLGLLGPINLKPFWECPQWGRQRECDGVVEEGGTEGSSGE